MSHFGDATNLYKGQAQTRCELQKSALTGAVRTGASTDWHRLAQSSPKEFLHSEMDRLHTAIFTLTVMVVMCWKQGKAAGLTDNTLQSTEPTGSPAPFSAVVDSVETPRVMKLLRPCSGDLGFCMNGQCNIHPDLNTPTCSCPQNYTGERCQHLVLESYGETDPEKLIAIGVAVALLLCGLIGALYCCVRKRCEKQKPYQICHSDLAV